MAAGVLGLRSGPAASGVIHDDYETRERAIVRDIGRHPHSGHGRPQLQQGNLGLNSHLRFALRICRPEDRWTWEILVKCLFIRNELQVQNPQTHWYHYINHWITLLLSAHVGRWQLFRFFQKQEEMPMHQNPNLFTSTENGIFPERERKTDGQTAM